MAVPVLPLLRSLVDAERFPAASWLEDMNEAQAQQLVDFVARQGLLPAMAGRVPLPDPSPFDPEFSSSLRSIGMRTWARNDRLLAAWRDIGRALRADGVSIIALKGVWFTQALYDDLAQRPMGDLDLLIDPRDSDRVGEQLASLGFRSHPMNAPGRKELWFDNPDAGVHLDVHLALTPSHGGFRLPVETLLERAEEVNLHGVPTRVLHRDDQFLHFALHAAVEHAFIPFRLLLDIALAWQAWGTQADWDALRVRARAGGFERALLTVALLGADLNGDPLPRRLVGTDVDRLRARVLPWILEHAPGLGNDELTRLVAFRPAISRTMHMRRRPLVAGPTASENSEPPAALATVPRSVRLGLLALVGIGGLLTRPARQRNAALSYLRLLIDLHRG